MIDIKDLEHNILNAIMPAQLVLSIILEGDKVSNESLKGSYDRLMSIKEYLKGLRNEMD